MKAKSIQVVIILAAAFTAFAIFLCLSLTDLAPFILMVTFMASACLIKAPMPCVFVSLKLRTQKNE